MKQLVLLLLTFTSTSLLVVAPRIAAVGLIVIGAFALTNAYWRRFNRQNLLAMALLLLSFMVWAVISLTWSLAGDEAGHKASTTFGLIALGLVVLSAFDTGKLAMFPGVRWALIFGASAGACVVLIATMYALAVGDSLWGSYYSNPLTTLNSSAVIVALLFWPVVALLAPVDRRLALGALPLVVGLLSLLASSAAVIALFVGICVAAFRYFLGAKAGIVMAAFAAVTLVAAPYIVRVSGADQYSSPAVVNDATSTIPYSARHRLAMWAFAANKIDEKPLLGWGFNASRHIPQEEFRLAPNMEIMPLHPHNLALQTRLELGVPGALILAGLVFVVFYRLATFTEDHWKSGLAMAPAAAWLFVANVSYGMWQSWWIALAFLLVVIMRLALADPPDRKV